MPDLVVPDELDHKQEIAARAVAAGCTQAQAGKAAQVCERTVRNWLADIPAFGARIEALKTENTTRVSRYFARKAYTAAQEVAAIAFGRKEASTTKLEALKLVLAHAVGKPGQGKVDIEALQTDQGQGIRITVGNP